MTTSRAVRSVRCAATAVVLIPMGVGCGQAGSTASTATASTTTASTTTASTTAATSASIGSVISNAKWAGNVDLVDGDGFTEFTSDGLPNHERQAEYALPNQGVVVPSAATATAGPDPTVAQSYDFKIPTSPKPADAPTDTSLGVIGLMISGAALYNPYEGDNSTVAAASNFTVKNAAGKDVAFLDACSGHPTPMGAYHYHALPACVTSQVDASDGPSHIIGVAFDGYPIYGNRDVDGAVVTADQLDGCNGITSPTPEFPSGTYHYVLLASADATSSIRCFSGEVDASLTQMQGMGPMGHP